MKAYTFSSSEIYHLDPADLALLQETETVPLPPVPANTAVILLGNEKTGQQDQLLKGREIVQKALKNKAPFVPVKIVFKRRCFWFDLLSPFCKAFRRRFTTYGTQTYHLDPHEIRQKRLERNIRTLETAFVWKGYDWTPAERLKRLDDLRDSIAQNGFDDSKPLAIMLCRSFGFKDTLHQGHHRMMVCIDLNITRAAIRFCAASHTPRFLLPFVIPLCFVVQKLKKRNFTKLEKTNENNGR